MKKKEIKVSITEDTLTKLDDFVSKLKSNSVATNRSQLIEDVISDYLKRMTKQSDTVKIS